MADIDDLNDILEGDPGTFRRIRQVMLSYIRNLLADNNLSFEDPEDIFQDALFKLFEKSKKSDFQLSSKVETYLYSISKRLIWNLRTKKSTTHENTSEDITKYSNESVVPDMDFADVEKEVLTDKAMMRLDESCRRLLQFYYLDELSRRKTAQELGYTETHVSHKKKDCLKKLKEEIMKFPEARELFGD